MGVALLGRGPPDLAIKNDFLFEWMVPTVQVGCMRLRRWGGAGEEDREEEGVGGEVCQVMREVCEEMMLNSGWFQVGSLHPLIVCHVAQS